MYGQEYIQESMKQIGKPNEYCFDITRFDNREGGDFNQPPVQVLIDFASDFTDTQLQDTVTRHSLMNRKVEVFLVPSEKIVTKCKEKDAPDIITYKKLQPVSIGGATINSLDASWDAFPVFTEHPLALKMLTEICTAHHLKNLLPLQD